MSLAIGRLHLMNFQPSIRGRGGIGNILLLLDGGQGGEEC